MKSNIAFRSVSIIMIMGLLGLLCFFSSRTFYDSYLWMDEAGQFFMSKGLHHHTERFATEGTLSDMFRYNSLHNLDPGGFTLLLRYWSCISNNVVWLRLLPLLFYLVSLIVTFVLGKKLLVHNLPAIILASILLLHPAYSINSCELRAYSMEMLGVVMIICIICWNSLKWNCKLLLFCGLTLSVFMTSRYSFILFALATILYIIHELIIQFGFKRAFLKIMEVSIFPVLIVLGIFILSLQNQIGGSDVGYVASQYIGSSPIALLSPSCLRFYFIVVIVAANKKKKIKTAPLLLLSFFVSALFFTASVFNLFPMDERRALSLSLVQNLAIVAWMLRLIKKEISKISLIGFIIVIIPMEFVFWPNLTRNRQRAIAEYKNFKHTILTIDSSQKIAICPYYDASVRYAIEFGELKNVVSDTTYLNTIVLIEDNMTDAEKKSWLELSDYYYYRKKDESQLIEIVPVIELIEGIYKNNKKKKTCKNMTI